MKKVTLGICAVAIIFLVALNLNLALNSDSMVNVTLASIVSLASPEGGAGCYEQQNSYRDIGHIVSVDAYCIDGSSPDCYVGWAGYDRSPITGNLIFCCGDGHIISCN